MKWDCITKHNLLCIGRNLFHMQNIHVFSWTSFIYYFCNFSASTSTASAGTANISSGSEFNRNLASSKQHVLSVRQQAVGLVQPEGSGWSALFHIPATTCALVVCFVWVLQQGVKRCAVDFVDLDQWIFLTIAAHSDESYMCCIVDIGAHTCNPQMMW